MQKRKRGKVDKDEFKELSPRSTQDIISKNPSLKVPVAQDVKFESYDVLEFGLDVNCKRRCGSPDVLTYAGGGPSDDGVDRQISQDVAVRLLPPRENVMLNELILGNLMQYTTLKDLVRNRLVCRRWNFEAIDFIKRQHLIEIIHEDSRRSIGRFIDSMKHSYLMPYRRFDLLFKDRMTKRLPNSYRTFFFLFGGYINHLSIGFLIDCEVNFSVHTFRNVFLMAVPNLISLAIDLPVLTTCEKSLFFRSNHVQFHRLESILIQDFVDDNDESTDDNAKARYSPGFMADLLKAAPALQKLSLFTDSRMLMSRVVTSLETVKLNRSPLTQLHLDGMVTEADVEALSVYEFQLRAIRIRWLNRDVTKRTLERFLAVHRKSLENLCIGDRCEYGELGEDFRRFHLQFPTMEKLNVLKITRRSCFSPRHQAKLYLTSGLSQLPVLKKLMFDTDFPEPFPHVVDFFPKSESKCYSLKELTFSCELLDHDVFLDVAKNFPEITTLSLSQASSPLLKIIFQCLLNIETLFLYLPVFERKKGLNIGSICIQLDVRNCKKICVLRSPREGFWFKVVFKKPAVGMLKKINTLEVETRSLKNSVHDVHVLAKFDELKTIYFNRKLTNKYRRHFCSHLSKVKLVEGTC